MSTRRSWTSSTCRTGSAPSASTSTPWTTAPPWSTPWPTASARTSSPASSSRTCFTPARRLSAEDHSGTGKSRPGRCYLSTSFSLWLPHERGEDLVDQRVGVGRVERRVADQQAVVDGAVEGVDRHADVEAGSQLATLDAALKDRRGFGAPAGDEALAQRLRQRGVVLRLGDQGPDPAAGLGARVELDHRRDLAAQVLARGSGVRERDARACGLEHRVHGDRGLARPPAVDRRLAHPGAPGDALDRQPPKAATVEQLARRAEDGGACLLVASPLVRRLGDRGHAASLAGETERIVSHTN